VSDKHHALNASVSTAFRLAKMSQLLYSITRMITPAYLQISAAELRERVSLAYARMERCDLCARCCKVNRLDGHLGVCKTGLQARVSSYGPHLGEENPLRGWKGSGTIFFARCNLRCQFCQNHDISQTDAGNEVTSQEVARMMLELQTMGCHNINLVSPSHVVPQILAALTLAVQSGLRLPLVYNSGGYDSLESLQLLDGIVDIYMPDMKFANGGHAKKYSRAQDYPQVNRVAVKEMHRQVGDLQIDENGLATRGLLVRHLVLPRNLAGTRQIVQFLVDEISKRTYLNLMAQYYPAYNANRFPELNRLITRNEYKAAVRIAREVGLTNLDTDFVMA
jgi:putative pyruvate formate lyase activating enzyme